MENNRFVALYGRLSKRDVIMGRTASSNKIVKWLKSQKVAEKDCQLYEDLTSAEFAKWPGLESLKRDIVKKDKIEMVVTRSLSRLWQSRQEFLKLLVLLQASKIRLVCVEDGLDTGTPLEHAIYKIAFSLDDAEKEIAIERLRDKSFLRKPPGRRKGTHDSKPRRKRRA